MDRYLIFLSLAILLCKGCSYLPEANQDLTDLKIRETRDYIELIPTFEGISNTGFIFYPGGLVDPHAYEDLASQFVRSGIGHHVIIAKMPANLAVLGTKSAKKITNEFPDENWIIGGHSLGGAMACSMLKKETERFVGLILMAAYAAGSADLNSWVGPVLSLTASNDQILDWGKYEEGKTRLPAQTTYFDIEGGNHGGFGSYGPQKGDGEAEISRAIQQQQIVEQIQNFYLENGFE